MDINNFTLLFIAFITFSLGGLVFFNNRKRLLNASFFSFTFFLSLWILNLIIISSELYEYLGAYLDYVARIPYTLIIGFVTSLYIFSKEFPKHVKREKKYDYLIYILAGFLFVLSLTSLMIKGMGFDESGSPIPIYGTLFYLFPFFFLGVIGLIFFEFHKKRSRLNLIQKNQLKVFIIGFTFFLVGALTTNLLLPAFLGINDFFIFGPIFLVVFLAFLSYSIIRYRAMDIRFLVTRSLIYAVLVLLVTFSFVLITFIGSELLVAESQTSEVLVLGIASFFIVLSLEPLKKVLAKVTNKIFFKAAIDYDTVTKRITNVINEELELDKLITRFSEEVQKDLRLQDANMLLPVGEGVFLVPEELINTDETKKKGRKKKTNTISKTPLLRYLHDNRSEVVIIDEIDRKVADAETDRERKRFDKMRNSMEDMNAYAALPIPSIVSHDLEAILILSRKKSGEPFSGQDIQLLQVIAPQLASGIQKARLFQEAKQFNVKLQREVDKATKELRSANEKLTELDRAKSEFMSIASHQLRTPLAGIIGYLSMIEAGDFGEVNKEQQPIIHDVTQATQRLIRMVNIFLNVTRIEAGRFVMNYTKQPFADVIEAIYKELKPTAEKKGVELVYKKKELPEVEVDADKIKDVILNLVDNAIKYSPEGRVEVSAVANTKTVHVMIKDSGVGIAPEEAKNLFSKFVRGSGIARVEPNGSGLGLFIAKKITEGHGGKIWAESEGEGKGSTFQFKIPIKADKESKKKAEEFKKRAKKE